VQKVREREVEKRECPGSEVLNGPLEVSRNPKFFALASFLLGRALSCRCNYGNSVLVIKNSSFTFALPPWLLLLSAHDMQTRFAALIYLSLWEKILFCLR